MDNKVVDNETVYFDVLASLDEIPREQEAAQRKLYPARLAAFSQEQAGDRRRTDL